MIVRIFCTTRPLRDSVVLAVRNVLRAGGLTAAGTARLDIKKIVAETLAAVRRDGDKRIIEDTRKLHGCRLRPNELKVPASQIKEALRDSDPAFLGVIRKAIANVRQYQKRILIKAPSKLRRGSRELSVRYTAVDRVAVYVPGGKAAYPSSVIMTVVPAQVAGVRDIVMITPPMENKLVKPEVLSAAGELGITEIYRVAGVAGLAAAAFGTKTIRPVDKIVGPGSAFVAEAKRQLFGRVGIDSVAGPSEVLILADDSARADWVAADMLAQAEHNPGSAVLVTTSARLAKAVASEIDKQLPRLSRRAALENALKKYSAIIVVPSLSAAIDVANDFAPEHLQIITAGTDKVAARVRNAGAIFLGQYTPVPLGDYYAGPSHVLPTGGAARFSSALSANDFLKATSVIRYDEKALAADAADVADFARREGLTAHARAVEIRRK